MHLSKLPVELLLSVWWLRLLLDSIFSFSNSWGPCLASIRAGTSLSSSVFLFLAPISRICPVHSPFASLSVSLVGFLTSTSCFYLVPLSSRFHTNSITSSLFLLLLLPILLFFQFSQFHSVSFCFLSYPCGVFCFIFKFSRSLVHTFINFRIFLFWFPSLFSLVGWFDWFSTSHFYLVSLLSRFYTNSIGSLLFLLLLLFILLFYQCPRFNSVSSCLLGYPCEGVCFFFTFSTSLVHTFINSGIFLIFVISTTSSTHSRLFLTDLSLQFLHWVVHVLLLSLMIISSITMMKCKRLKLSPCLVTSPLQISLCSAICAFVLTVFFTFLIEFFYQFDTSVSSNCSSHFSSINRVKYVSSSLKVTNRNPSSFFSSFYF